MGRFIDRAELFNRLAVINTEDTEFRAKVYQIISELEGYEVVSEPVEDGRMVTNG